MADITLSQADIASMEPDLIGQEKMVVGPAISTRSTTPQWSLTL